MSLLQTEMAYNIFFISDAKSAGDYDIGIRTLTGNKVSVTKTRAFNFRGSEAKDESVLVHRVEIDQGMSSDTALKAYDEALQADDQNGRIKTGFYIDGHESFKQCPPVYLVIRLVQVSVLLHLRIFPHMVTYSAGNSNSMGRTSPNAAVLRPNNGRTCYNIDHVLERFVRPSSRCDDMAKVRKTWDTGEK